MTILVTQQRVLDQFKIGDTKSAYTARAKLSTLEALVKKGFLKNVTPPGPGGMFSPTTHFQFKRIK